MKKKLGLLLLLPFLASCSVTGSVDDVKTDEQAPLADVKRFVNPLGIETLADSNDSEEEEPVTPAPTLDGYGEIDFASADRLFEKGKSFKNYNKIHFTQKGNDRDDDINYRRYHDLYTIDGTMDSSLDAFDAFDATGFVGFPKDGSIDKFYDVLRADPVAEHAKAYDVLFGEDATKENEISYQDAVDKLDNYENNFANFVADTYDILKSNSDYVDLDTVKVGTKSEDSLTKIRVIGSKDTSLLGTDYTVYYQIDGTISADGSFSQIGFVQTYSLGSSAVVEQNLDISYGAEFDNSSLLDIYDPADYFVQGITDISFDDVWIPDEEKNTISVGNTILLQPYYKGLLGATMFQYYPESAVDEYDISFISSSDESVLKPLTGSDKGKFTAMKPGKATLTIGSTYNPFVHKEFEVTVRYADASSISMGYPFNTTLDTINGYLNSESLLTPAVNPYCAVQDYTVVSNNPDVFSVRKNSEGQVVIKGLKKGSGTLTVTASTPDTDGKKVSRTMNVEILEKLSPSMIVGTYACDNLYQFYGVKFEYVFNADKTGSISIIGKGYNGDETVTVGFTYKLDYATQDIVIKPIGGTISTKLKRVHIYNSSFLYTSVDYGEYTLPINFQVRK